MAEKMFNRRHKIPVDSTQFLETKRVVKLDSWYTFFALYFSASVRQYIVFWQSRAIFERTFVCIFGMHNAWFDFAFAFASAW
jgi:hypothetical protein